MRAGAPGGATVGHLVGQRVFERILELWEEARLIEELGRLEPREDASQLILRQIGHRLSRPKGRSFPTTDAACSSRLSSGGSRSMRPASTASIVAGTWISPSGFAKR